MLKTTSFRHALSVIALFATCFSAHALNWPQGQLLPSFPATCQTQDLIYINGTNTPYSETWRWEAEDLPGNTGRNVEGGRLCQTGIDQANTHMVYGPYYRGLPMGDYKVKFRIKVDNNTANNDKIVTVDVRDNTNGNVLASADIKRQDFETAGTYCTFTYDFTLNYENHDIETRVYWYGASYTMVDWIEIESNNDAPEQYLFASLKGLVNRKQPRIFSYEGDAFAEGPYTWLNSLKLKYVEHKENRWEVLDKYLSEVSGLVVYDPSQIHSVNIATVISSQKNALICAPTLVKKLTSAPYNLPVLTDLRGRYLDKMAVYNDLYNNYWSGLDKRAMIGISPQGQKAAVREYAVATGLGVVWLDPKVSEESTLLNKFLGDMPRGACWLGWWPEEEAGVRRASEYGIATIASDYACNLTVHSGMPRRINTKAPPAKPALQNKIYVSFILSDGDNLQYVEHLMRKLWNNYRRGQVPMGWTLSPAMVDAMPGALNFYHQSATDNDCLVSGPSGYGYSYPNFYNDQAELTDFTQRTETYNREAGLRVVTVWNTITGNISTTAGENYAANSPTLLGLTSQNTGGGLTIFSSKLPSMALSCNYCTGQEAMRNHLASAAAGWNGNEPRFIIIQAQPWTDVKPENFYNVAQSLGSDYIVVRPDHIFQLIRERNGLSTDPGSDYTYPNYGLVTAYVDCDYKGFHCGFGVGTYTTADLNNAKIKNNNLSSVKVSEGYKAVLYKGDNCTGDSLVVTADVACVPAEWNDQTSSIRVSPNGERGLDGLYYLKNKLSDMYMDVKGGTGATDQGIAVIQAPYYGTDNQRWQLTEIADGSYTVTARHSGFGLDVSGYSYEAGTVIHQWPYWETPNQRFILVSNGDGYYHLIAEHTGMYAQTSTTTLDEQLHQWWQTDNNGALWQLQPVDLTGVAESDDASGKLRVYPNPTSEYVYINYYESAGFALTDLGGRLLMTGTLTAGITPLAVANLAPGIYLLHTPGGTFRIVKR
ncbi:MAG: RICIN domain-containing protein [Paludibacteraceae bacterium]|nr:RICIN domain-containing protein [Paludibacteraceae bacterium]